MFHLQLILCKCNFFSFLQSDDDEVFLNFDTRRPARLRPDEEVVFNFASGRKRQRSQTSDDDFSDFDLPYEEDYDDSAFFDPMAEVPNSNVTSAASSTYDSATSTPATTMVSTPPQPLLLHLLEVGLLALLDVGPEQRRCLPHLHSAALPHL